MGSNPVEGMDVHLLCLLRVEYVVASEELIARSEESYWLHLTVYELEISTMRWPRPKLGCCTGGGAQIQLIVKVVT